MFALVMVVFAITLVLTKSNILAGKREFVEQRYEASKVNGRPSWFHRWWHSMWTCPMCSGFWIAAIVCPYFPVYAYIVDVLIVFSLNWLVHCLEDFLFYLGRMAKTLDES